MFEFGGDVSVSWPLAAVKFRLTSRCSKLNAWVEEPARTSATEAMLAASGVVTWNEVL